METSNVTGRHQGHTALSLHRTYYLWVGLLCEASSIFHSRVWYRALSLCYACIRHSGIIFISKATFVPSFISVEPSVAELAREETLRTLSITHSLTQLIWCTRNWSFCFRTFITVKLLHLPRKTLAFNCITAAAALDTDANCTMPKPRFLPFSKQGIWTSVTSPNGVKYSRRSVISHCNQQMFTITSVHT